MATEQITRTQPKEGTLVHFEIPASDPAKISKFYEELFGWKFTKMEGGNMDYWLISHKDATDPNDTLGGLFKRNTAQEQILNYMLVKSIDESLPKATKLGATVLMAKQEIPNIGWFAVLTDPDGNNIALFQSTNRM